MTGRGAWAGSDSGAADVVQDWFSLARKLGAGQLSTWRRSIGGCMFEFRCTNPQLSEIIAARLTDLGDGVGPVFRVDLLETDVLGWPPPPAPFDRSRDTIVLHQAFESRKIAAVVPERRAGEIGFPWVAFDTTSRSALVVVRRIADLPPWMVNAPFSLPLHLAFAWHGCRLLHAASLGLEGRGVLLAGAGGAGKSATTISGLLEGLSTVGDDYVVVDFGRAPKAWPVYRTLKQAPAGLSRFPTLQQRIAGLPLNWHGKIEFDADLVRPDCIVSNLAIEAILIPQGGEHAATRFEPAPATAAFSALAPSTLSQLPGAGLAGFANLTRLTRTVPAFRLHLSADPDEVGTSLRRFLAKTAA